MQNLQTVSADFPHNFSDKQIQETIRDYMTRIAVSGSQENVVIQCYPLIALGQAELQKRQNDRLTRITLVVSFVSLIVAAIALYMTYQNTESSDQWEKRQLVSLEAIQLKLASIDLHLKKLVVAETLPNASEPISASSKK